MVSADSNLGTAETVDGCLGQIVYDGTHPMSRIESFSLPLKRPLATSERTMKRREGFLVQLDDNPPGIGEASPLPGWTESLEMCHEALVDAAPSTARSIDLQSMTGTPAARHGLELALLDHDSRKAGLPLYQYLGNKSRVNTVPVNATVGDDDVQGTVRAARNAATDGFPTIKIKVGARSIDEDYERLEAVREGIDDHVNLRVDANGAWSLSQAVNAVEQFAEIDISVVEQPLAPSSLAAHADLRDLGVDIALDESLRKHGVDAVLEADAADLLVLKPMVLGGIHRTVDVADRARGRGLGVIVTTTIDAAVARTAAVHLAAALDVDRACGLATAGRLAEDVANDPSPVVEGAISVPQFSGNGVTVEDLN